MIEGKWLAAVGVVTLAAATVMGSARAGSANEGAAAAAAKDGGVFELAAKEAGVEFAKDGGALMAKEAGVNELAIGR